MFNLKISRHWVGFLAFALLFGSAVAADPNPSDLLLSSDRARGGGLGGLSMESKVVSYRDGAEDQSYTLQIEADQNSSLVTFLTPATSAGKMMLMQNRNMWFISPDVSKPVPISPRQRLLGEASNGDVATTNYSRDYDASMAGVADVNGQACYVLDLKAKEQNVTYDRIKYYISKNAPLALKAEYFTLSDKLLKTSYMEYENTITYQGKQIRFISKFEIQDQIQPGQNTVLTYINPKAASIPQSHFDLRSLLNR